MVNDLVSVARLFVAAELILEPEVATAATQSLGGEAFAWYLQTVPGVMAWLETRTPGATIFELHQGDLIVDDWVVIMGARLLLGAGMAHLPH